MKKNKIGPTLIVLFALLVGGVLLWDHIDDKHDEKLLQTAQNVDIGDGVTLIEGLRAFCGSSIDWYIRENDTVEVVALGAENAVSATLKVNIKTGDVDVLEFYYDVYLLNRDDMAVVISDMIEAARE